MPPIADAIEHGCHAAAITMLPDAFDDAATTLIFFMMPDASLLTRCYAFRFAAVTPALPFRRYARALRHAALLPLLLYYFDDYDSLICGDDAAAPLLPPLIRCR